MGRRLCLVVCRNFAPETAAVMAAADFKDINLTVFPDHCRGGGVDWGPLIAALQAAKADGWEICLVDGGCLAARRDLPQELAALSPPPSGHCTSQFAGRTLTDSLIRQGAFLMTPGWLANWQEYVEGNGFDRKTAREFFGETASRLLLLDTGSDPQGAAHLREFADYVGLPGEVLPVGLDFYRLFLADIILKKRLEQAQESEAARARETGRLAEYAMALDLMGSLAEAKAEAGVIEKIFELFKMACAPAHLLYVSLSNGREPSLWAYPENLKPNKAAIKRLGDLKKDYAWTESGTGFQLRIGDDHDTLGVLEIEGLAFPEHREHYLNLGLNSVKVCTLAIRNARAYEKLEQSLKERQRLLELVQEQSEELQAANEELETQNEELQGQTEELEQLSRELLRAKEDWERTFDAVPDQIAILDKDHHLVRVNQAMAAALGVEPRELVGKPCYQYMHRSSCPPEICPHSLLIQDRQEHTAELRELGRDFLVTVSPIEDGRGNFFGSVHVARDITERKRAEEALYREKNISDTTIESLPGIFYLIDSQGQFLKWNKNFELVSGYSSEEIARMHPLDFFAGEDVHRIEQAIQEVFTKGTTSVEADFISKDGHQTSYFFTGLMTTLDQANCLIGMGVDITARKRAEEALHRLNDELEQRIEDRTAQLVAVYGQLDAFFTHSITPMVFLDKDFNFIRVNEAYARSCQRRAEDFPGHNHFELYPHEENQAIFAEVVRNKRPYQAIAKPFEFPDHPEWGVTYWDWTLMPILNEAGEVDFLVFSLKDVTERCRAQEALEFERRRFFEVLERIPAHVSLLRPDYTFAFVNGEFVRRFGDPGSKRCHELMGRQSPCTECQGMQVFHTGTPSVWEWTSPAGRHYQNYHYPFIDVDGSPMVLEMGVDFTDRKAAEEKIRQLNEELEQRVKERTAELEFANRELESFAYSVSHDLKAPIRAIQGFSRMLLGEHSDRLDEEGLRLFQVIVDNTRIMANLIDDLLALSRVGRHQIRKAHINLAALTGKVFERLREQVPERDLQLTMSDPPAVLGDPSLINQVMMNLLDNAIKYTKARKTAVIEVGGYTGEGEAIYYVKDNGVGFDERYAHKLFGVFQRLHGGREYEGTGVGLAIVQRIIHRHGGRVWAEGKLNEGATFYFALPTNSQ